MAKDTCSQLQPNGGIASGCRSALAQYLKGKSSYRLLREFPALKEKILGQPPVGTRILLLQVGAVTEEMVKRYIEDQESTRRAL